MLLRTEKLTQHFGGLFAVQDVDYQLNKGELAAIIGPNGAGKSTFFKAIVGTFFPTGGKIFFNDKEITKTSPDKRVHLGIAMAHQIVQIFPSLTLLENMTIASQRKVVTNRVKFFLSSWDSDYSVKKAESYLDLVHLLPKKNVMAADLPQGEKKALEIGMAISTEPKLLLLDEPTAGSSPVETKLMMDLIREIHKKYTILVVEHKMDVIMNLCERVTVMAKGQLIADGTPNEIRNNKLVKEVYLGDQSLVR
jgi:branched-chain amino acid transport system ATP-binding protein